MDYKINYTLTKEHIDVALAPFGISLSPAQQTFVATYIQKLLIWNQTISITSLEDPTEILRRHFGESAFAASILPIKTGRLADVGTGGGFPGLVLKIFRPELDVVLIEANSKKCAFLTEVITALGLTGVRVAKGRYEELELTKESLDFVCARALGDYRRLLRWSSRVLQPDGSVVLWLGMEDAVRISKMSGWRWDDAVRIPESRRRFILRGRVFKA